jgi:hypothetical protein
MRWASLRRRVYEENDLNAAWVKEKGYINHDRSICDCDTETNARLIVQAVNNHDDLVRIVRNMRVICSAILDQKADGLDRSEWLFKQATRYYAAANEALVNELDGFTDGVTKPERDSLKGG